MRWSRKMALVLLAVPLFAQPLWGGKRQVLDRIKIKVNDKALTALEVEEFRNIQVNVLKSQFTGQQLERNLRTLERNLTEKLVEDLLIESHAERLKIEVGDRVIEERVDLILRRQPALADAYSDEQLKSLVLKEILRQRVLAREVDAHIRITDADVVRACERDAGGTRELDVGHILIRGDGPEALARIRELREQLLAGADFETLARQSSQDPSVKQNGGRLGFISRGQFVKPFEEAAFSLSPGALSDPVRTRFGFHLIKVFSERSKGQRDCDNLERVARQNYRNRLFSRRREERLKEFLQGLREKAVIQVVDGS